MTYFGMVTTGRSRHYTVPALDSFFRWTEFAIDDRFLLIDNDGDFELPSSYSRIELVRHERPHSFATNVNLVIKEAARRDADVVFLNNDIIFTPGWLPPLCVANAAILIPMCNNHVTYQHGGLKLQPEMNLEDYVGHEDDLLTIAATHSNDRRMEGFLRPLHAGFYCFRLPRLIYSTIGLFDEGFETAGGEDTDYRIRAHLAGFDIGVAAKAYVLHFVGRSTWRSGEGSDTTRSREAVYNHYFRAKWGDDLARIFIVTRNWKEHAAAIGLESILMSGDYRRAISLCLARRYAVVSQ